jgi:hypothetical protein
MKRIIIFYAVLILTAINIYSKNKVDYEYDDFTGTGMWVLTCDI